MQLGFKLRNEKLNKKQILNNKLFEELFKFLITYKIKFYHLLDMAKTPHYLSPIHTSSVKATRFSKTYNLAHPMYMEKPLKNYKSTEIFTSNY